MTHTTTRILRTRLSAALVCALMAGAAAAVETPAARRRRPFRSPPKRSAVKKLVEQRFPTAVIRGVVKTPYFGLYEIQLDDQFLYTDTKVNYVMAGSVYDANTKQNLTEAKLRKLNRVAFDTLPLDLAFKRVKGNGQRKMAIFSDADCPFCAKLEDELKAVDNVTIYTFLFPIDALHPDSARKSKMIWCSSDRVKSWEDFFASGRLPDNNGECDNPVEATNALGKKLHVQATPTLVFADGNVVPGAIPTTQLETELANAQAESAKQTAAKK